MISFSTLFALQRYIDTGGDVNLDENLVAHYLLNNNADDSHGAFDGTPTNVDFQGDVGVFDETAYINCGDVLDLGTDDRTYSMWFKSNHTNVLIAKSKLATLDYRVWLQINTNSNFEFNMVGTSGNTKTLISNTVFSPNTLYHIVCTVNRTGNVEVHIDTVKDINTTDISTLNGQNFNTSTDFVLGGYNDANGDASSISGLNGMLSNIRIYNDVKDQTFIDELFTEGYYPKPLTAPTTTNLIAHYPLTGTAEDSTGTYDGTEEGSLSYSDNSEFGSVGIFDRRAGQSGDHVLVSTPINTSTGDFTISGWIKKDDATNGWIINNRSWYTLNTQEWEIYFYSATNNYLNFTMYNSAETSFTANFTNIPIATHTEWYHFACKISGTSMTTYTNGVQDSTQTFSGTRTDGSLSTVIGCPGWDLGDETTNYDGELRNIKVYDSALTAQEITDIYNYEKNFRSIDIDDGLLRYYPLKNNALDNYYDELDGTDYGDSIYDGEKVTFDGINDEIRIPIADFTDNYSISVWLSVDASGSMRCEFDKTGDRLVRLYSNAYSLSVLLHGSTAYIMTAVTVSQYEIKHLVITSNNNNITSYIDGALHETGSVLSPISLNDDVWAIGADRVGNEHWIGSFKDFRVYNKAITAEQVKVIYDSEKQI